MVAISVAEVPVLVHDEQAVTVAGVEQFGRRRVVRTAQRVAA